MKKRVFRAKYHSTEVVEEPKKVVKKETKKTTKKKSDK